MKSRGGEDRMAQAKSIDLRTVIPVRSVEKSAGSAYIHGYCPMHENDDREHKTKSFLVYKDHYVCLSTNCGQYGDIVNWYCWKLYGNPRPSMKNGVFKTVLDAILGANALPTTPMEEEPAKVKTEEDFEDLETLAQTCHEVLLSTPLRLTYFLSRGFTMKTIRQEMWGWDGKRYTITIWEGAPQKSRLLALRYRARPGDESYIRYSGVRDFNEKLIYNPVAVQYASRHELPIVVMYGELDARLSWQYRVPTVSPTNGALSFQAEWLDGFDGDIVFVPDRGEEKAAFQDASRLGAQAWVVQYPEGDYKDLGEMVKVEGTPVKLWKRIYMDTRIKFFKKAALGTHAATLKD